MAQHILYVGTYTTKQPHVDGKGVGLQRFKVTDDIKTGEIYLNPIGSPIDAGSSPTYLAISPCGKLLFATNEELNEGGLTVLSIDPTDNGNLTKLAYRPCGAGSCHVAVDKSGGIVVVSNYWEGSVNVFKIGADRQPTQLQYIKYAGGSGVVPDRQGSAHAHGCIFDINGQFAYIGDLGNDCLWRYNFDPTKGLLVETEKKISLPPGSGPRSTAFHPSGEFLYITGELSCQLLSLRISDLTVVQQISTLSCKRQAFHSNADLQITPDGQSLLVGVRGDPKDETSDYITIFKVAADGSLTKQGHQDTFGKIPRHFIVGPKGNWLLAANQDSDTICAFRSESAGLLKPIGQATHCPTPVFLQLSPQP